MCLLSQQRTYIFTFLLSSRLFIHPYELMSKVCHLCTEQQRLGDPQADKVCWGGLLFKKKNHYHCDVQFQTMALKVSEILSSNRTQKSY